MLAPENYFIPILPYRHASVIYNDVKSSIFLYESAKILPERPLWI